MVADGGLVIRSFEADDTEAVVALWEAAGLTRPWNDPRRDIARKMTVQPELFLVGCADEQLVASAMGGYDGHRGWVYYVAVDPQCQGRGFGRQIMEHLEGQLIAIGCPKINLQVRTGNADPVNFYEATGYTLDDTVALGKRLIPDN